MNYKIWNKCSTFFQNAVWIALLWNSIITVWKGRHIVPTIIFVRKTHHLLLCSPIWWLKCTLSDFHKAIIFIYIAYLVAARWFEAHLIPWTPHDLKASSQQMCSVLYQHNLKLNLIPPTNSHRYPFMQRILVSLVVLFEYKMCTRFECYQSIKWSLFVVFRL